MVASDNPSTPAYRKNTARAVEDKGAIARAVEQHVLPLVAAGRVKPIIDSSYALAQAALAHARMESSVHIGKIVLVW